MADEERSDLVARARTERIVRARTGRLIMNWKIVN